MTGAPIDRPQRGRTHLWNMGLGLDPEDLLPPLKPL